MYAVVEERKIGQIVNTIPLEGDVFLKACANGLEDRGVRPNLRMAGHAGLRRRYSCKSRGLYRRVTVPAIQPDPADVMLVAERNGLFSRHFNACDIRRPIHREHQPYDCGNHKNRAKNTDASDRVGAAMEGLSHRLGAGSTVNKSNSQTSRNKQT